MLHEPVIKVATENLRYTRVKRACASTQAKNSTSNQLKALLPYMLIASCVGDFGHMSVLIACKRNRKKNTLAAFNSVNFVSGAVLSAFYAFSPLLFKCCTLKSFGYLLLFFFFLAVLRVVLKAWHLLGRCSTTRAIQKPFSLFCVGYF
jgi:hypothetical protein